MARELKPCGTVAAYQRHLSRGEDACPACAAARRDYNRERLVRFPYARRNMQILQIARRRAQQRLAWKFPALYEELYAEERDRARKEARDDAR